MFALRLAHSHSKTKGNSALQDVSCILYPFAPIGIEPPVNVPDSQPRRYIPVHAAF